ncbi:unnamed protein product [Mytilus coruscus]|uniref:Uncharacterized protein n=1 Tax=Mytilus coruscus TaxID=42192 RepID=A0A6J8ARK8_MYTCO|nr:unnamed protein product [Mytilus coruscus]
MKIELRPGVRHGNADSMSRLVTHDGGFCQQCEMPLSYEYDGPTETEVKYMKEGEKTDVIGAVFKESDSEVDEHAQTSTGVWAKVPGQGGLSLPIEDDSEELPVERRGRKQNQPRPAKQKRKPEVNFSLDAIKEYQQSDEILSKILKLKTEQTEKPAWKDISDKSLEFKSWSDRRIACGKEGEEAKPASTPAKQKKKPEVDFSLDAIKEYQQSDEILSKILKLKTEQTEKPAWKDISDKSLEFKSWSARWELLEIKNGVLVMK